jgi:hypothetical protein
MSNSLDGDDESSELLNMGDFHGRQLEYLADSCHVNSKLLIGMSH